MYQFFLMAILPILLCSCELWRLQNPETGLSLSSDEYSDICVGIMSQKATQPLSTLVELPKRFLASHNDIRARYGLSNLVWDEKIAAYATQWANHLRDTNKCKMRHRSDKDKTKVKKYGENLAWNWIYPKKNMPFQASPEFAVLGWAQECIDYNYTNNTCQPGKQCGHFTQLLWETTTRVGCGVATCEGTDNSEGKGMAEVWVCNYAPVGNIADNVSGKWVVRRPF